MVSAETLLQYLTKSFFYLTNIDKVFIVVLTQHQRQKPTMQQAII